MPHTPCSTDMAVILMSDKAPETIKSDLSGRQLGDFRLLRRLGRGAMAEVYLAEQTQLRRQVAVKVLRRELAADETYIKRFQREAQTAAALVHANIVQIYEVGCVDSNHYIAQEYVQGENLRQWMARHGNPDARMAWLIIRQVAAALAKAAELGIVHRDIKPENILLTRSGEVKVADFGLARLPGKSDATTLTQIGMTMGTPLYMSPEQVEGQPLDPRSDIYSLGVTCYHFLAGKPPFEGETPLTVAIQHLRKMPEPLENQRRDLPPAMCRIVHKMLAKAPEGRYQSAQELLRDLRQLQKDEPSLADLGNELPIWEAESPSSPLPLQSEATERLELLMKTQSVARPARRWRWLWALGCAAAFLIGLWLARLTVVEPFLLADLQEVPSKVPQQPTVTGQVLYAKMNGGEAAWRAVAEYFPEPEHAYWRKFADRQRALIYLKDRQEQQAMEIFEQFAAESDEELQAFGLVGKCWVLTSQGRNEESAQLLNKLWEKRQRLADPLVHAMLSKVIRANQHRLDPNINQKWLDWLETSGAEGG